MLKAFFLCISVSAIELKFHSKIIRGHTVLKNVVILKKILKNETIKMVFFLMLVLIQILGRPINSLNWSPSVYFKLCIN